MQATSLYQAEHQWVVFARDPEKPNKIIDTNQYMIISDGKGLLLDPGGIELFPAMLSNALKYVEIDNIVALFASHQDPDIISSLGLWDKVLPKAKLYSSWMWEGFIRHFGMNSIEYSAIADDGGEIEVGNTRLQLIPAHYLHSSGNFNVYDPIAKILFSGDLGAALEPDGAPLFVEDFEEHIQHMKGFHQRWLPSNEAKLDWINRVRRLNIDMIVPQHGRIFKGEQVGQFLDWLERLPVGTGVSSR